MSIFRAKAASVNAALPQLERRLLDRAGIGELWSGCPDLGATRPAANLISLTFWLLASLTVPSAFVYAQEPNNNSNSVAVQITLELASDFSNADPLIRAETLALIEKQDEIATKEIALGNAVLAGISDSHYRSLVSAQTDKAFAYL